MVRVSTKRRKVESLFVSLRHEHIASHRRADGGFVLDPPYVRDWPAASPGARPGERLRLHAGEPRRGASPGCPGGPAAGGGGGAGPESRVHAERRVPPR